jgi:UDP-N-acetylmuramate dehydrogenase
MMEADLLTLLPKVRGRYQPHAPLGPQVWFRTGGPAEVLFKPEDPDDLKHFLKHTPPHIPITVIGVGSNLLIRDGGVRGVVIKLGKGFNEIRVEGTTLIAGAAALDRTVALESAERGLSGFEYFIGIPGTIGGAIKMNAGAYGQEVKDHLISCEVITRSGEQRTKTLTQLGFTYRTSTLSDDEIVISASFQGVLSTPSIIHARLNEIIQQREATQPVRSRTGGSTFKNPLPQKAWELIDQAGCRGLKKGGAQISEKHCNFLINTGTATSSELESLAEEVRERVKEKTGTFLQWEIKRIGTPT